MTDRWKQLLAADPSDRTFTPADDLRTEIRRGPVDTAPRRRRFWRPLSRGAAVLIAALVVGGAVAWATTGVGFLDRIERMWGVDSDSGLTSGSSDLGLDDISILKPMNNDRIEELPKRLKHSLVGFRSEPLWTKDHELKLALEPGRISAWGETTTIGGDGVPSQRVDVLSINDRICMVWDSVMEAYCGSLQEARKEGLSITVRGTSKDFTWTSGLVTDDVISLQLAGATHTDVPIRDNVFQLNVQPKEKTFLLGRDREGSVVTRIYVPGGLSKCDRALTGAINRWKRNREGPPPEPSPDRCGPG